MSFSLDNLFREGVGLFVHPDSTPTPEVTPMSDATTAKLAAALKAAAPGADPAKWVPALQTGFDKFGLNTPQRQAAAIGQFAVESADFTATIENTNYTHADRLMAIFPHEFPTLESAQAVVGNPRAIANAAYAGKNGNGDADSGDGYAFRGRGLIQLTGRNDYVEFAADDMPGQPPEAAAAYLESPEGAAVSGCWYLAKHGCLEHADNWEISAITRIVNGRAMLNNAQRISAANAALQVLQAP
jgi:predicted chitinase